MERESDIPGKRWEILAQETRKGERAMQTPTRLISNGGGNIRSARRKLKMERCSRLR